MKGWAECRDHFVGDGSLRDIYVVGGGADSWAAFLKFVESFDVTFEVDGAPRPIPRTVEEAFAVSGEATALLKFNWHGLLVCCHFFDPLQVELDIDPREVESPSRFASILDLMKGLAHAAGRKVVLTPENMYEHPLLEATPNGETFDVSGAAQQAVAADGASPRR